MDQVDTIQNKHREFSLSRFSSIFITLLVFCESMMNKIITTVLPIDNMLGFVMVLACVLVLLSHKIRLPSEVLIVYFIVLFSFFYSLVFVGGNVVTEYFIQFLSFGTCGIICAITNIDIKKTFYYAKWVTVVFLIISILQNFYDAKVSNFNFGYALIPGLIATVLDIFNQHKHTKRLLTNVWLYICAAELICFLLYSGRGNIVQLAVFVFLCLIVIFRKKILGLTLIGCGAAAYMSIEQVITALYEWTVRMNINVGFIWKSYYYLEKSDLSNGRNLLNDQFRNFVSFRTYAFGNGIGSFEKEYGTYTHNIISQALAEFGIVGIIFVVVLFIELIRLMIDKNNSLLEKELYIFIFVIGMVKLLFSSVYWKTSIFWFAVVIVIKKIRQSHHTSSVALRSEINA